MLYVNMTDSTDVHILCDNFCAMEIEKLHVKNFTVWLATVSSYILVQ